MGSVTPVGRETPAGTQYSPISHKTDIATAMVSVIIVADLMYGDMNLLLLPLGITEVTEKILRTAIIC